MPIETAVVLRAPAGTVGDHPHTPLSDGVIVRTEVDFGSEPDELSAALRLLLDEAVDAHRDPRGVFVYPANAKPKGATVDAVIDELGELGMFVPVMAREDAHAYANEHLADAMPADLMQMLGAIPPGVLAQAEAMMQSGDMASMQALQGQLERSLAAHGGIEKLQSSLMQMLSGAGVDMDALAAQFAAGAGGDGDGDDEEGSPDAPPAGSVTALRTGGPKPR